MTFLFPYLQALNEESESKHGKVQEGEGEGERKRVRERASERRTRERRTRKRERGSEGMKEENGSCVSQQRLPKNMPLSSRREYLKEVAKNNNRVQATLFA